MVAIPPSSVGRDAYIVISSQVETNVTLRKELQTWEIYVPDEGAIRHPLDDSYRVTYDLEYKAFEITSDVPVTVYLGTYYQDSYYTPDDILMKPIGDTDTEFVIASYIGDTTSGSRPGSFFMIIPKLAGTLVQVFKYENDLWVQQYVGVIHKFQVLTHDAYYSDDRYQDFTGWRILANLPIAVISGHGYAYFGSQYNHVCDSLESLSTAGTEYITYPVVLGVNATFYKVRIVGSATEDVIVRIPEVSFIKRIPKGGFVEVDSESLTSMMRVSSRIMMNRREE